MSSGTPIESQATAIHCTVCLTAVKSASQNQTSSKPIPYRNLLPCRNITAQPENFSADKIAHLWVSGCVVGGSPVSPVFQVLIALQWDSEPVTDFVGSRLFWEQKSRISFELNLSKKFSISRLFCPKSCMIHWQSWRILKSKYASKSVYKAIQRQRQNVSLNSPPF